MVTHIKGLRETFTKRTGAFKSRGVEYFFQFRVKPVVVVLLLATCTVNVQYEFMWRI